MIFGGTVGVGKTVGPVSAAPVKTEAAHGGHQAAPAKTEAAHSGHEATAQQPRTDTPGGLQVSEAGYTLIPLTTAITPGQATDYRFSVTGPDGKPVTDLQPCLGAYSRLVALRARDLGYLHVHPDGEPGDGNTQAGPEIVFHTEVPSTGDYRLFPDFQHAGAVHTASFTAQAGKPAALPSETPTASPSPTKSAGHGDHDH